mmetsp:Transcript_46156/g.121951  ORF Transcript_46156/g.121951 Transcript_46156/m.121951 type:complete len:258 (-) Transcript_46156:196-969(-)
MKFTIACAMVTVAGAVQWHESALESALLRAEQRVKAKVDDALHAHPERTPPVLGGSKPVRSMADIYNEAVSRGSHSSVGKAHGASMAQLYARSVRVPTKDLLPIGEGAYQSHEAVKQRTTDNIMDCESGNWNDCFLKDGSDLVDGHSYGHLKKKGACMTIGGGANGKAGADGKGAAGEGAAGGSRWREAHMSKGAAGERRMVAQGPDGEPLVGHDGQPIPCRMGSDGAPVYGDPSGASSAGLGLAAAMVVASVALLA